MKHTYKILLFTICFFMGTIVTFAQDQNWSVDSPLVNINGTDVELNSVLIKDGTSITWQQVGYNSTESYTYTITGVSGNWNSQTHQGELIYDLSIDNTAARLEVKGNSEGIILVLTMTVEGNSSEDRYEFITENITNL